MGLVYSYQPDASGNVPNSCCKALVIEALRGTVKNPELRIPQLGVDDLELVPRLAGVDTVGRDPAFLKRIHLIFHQGDQGRHHDGDAGCGRIPFAFNGIELWKGNGGDLAQC